MDHVLSIQTEGIQNDGKDTFYLHRYEPTPYEVLSRIFDYFPLKESDTIVDYGCGKGRINFYVHHRFSCESVGIEYNRSYYNDALDNLRTYIKSKTAPITFHCIGAEEYIVQPNENYFYFFNPFSIHLFMKTIEQILRSVEETPRKVSLLLYYPDEEYCYYLSHCTAFECKDSLLLSNKDSRECVLRYDYVPW